MGRWQKPTTRPGPPAWLVQLAREKTQDTGFKHLVQACSEPTCILVLVRAGGAGNSACPKSTPDYRYSDASTPFVHASDETIISYLTI